ncbi:hypothetical protein CBS9595_001712 [Malassezia furfur]|nr:hypothetical protein CBS9595_001712 [Malassezia furfur]
MSDDQAHRASDSRAGTPVELLRSAAALMDGTDPRTARGINAGHAMPSTSQPRRSFSKTTVMAEAGRQPWYDQDGHPISPYIVGVAGGSASGKTSIAKEILRHLPNVPWVAIVSQDAFYRPLNPTETKLAFEQNFDFDHPNAIDQELLVQCIRDLKESRAVHIPVYSFTQHQRTDETTYLYGHAVIVVEGLFVLQDKALVDLLDLKIFVQTDPDVMLARRIRRDIVDRGRSIDGVLDQYFRFADPVGPTARYADIIVPGANNAVAIDVIAQHIARQLTRNYACQMNESIPRAMSASQPQSFPASRLVVGTSEQGAPMHAIERAPFHDPITPAHIEAPIAMRDAGHVAPLPPNVLVVRQTAQLVGLLTLLHNADTRSGEFAYACKRIGAHVVETAMSLLPYRSCEVPLHTGGTYTGVELDAQYVCGVSILRSGAILEAPLRRALPAIALGSLLIQSSDTNYRPLLYSVSLPSFVKQRDTAQHTYVFLTEAQIGTGAAAFMAVRVLLDHGVPEHQIIVLTLLASAKSGVWALQHAFPGVRIVAGGVDPGLQKFVWSTAQRRAHARARAAVSAADSESDTEETVAKRVVFAITPGCGQMGDRYWGT